MQHWPRATRAKAKRATGKALSLLGALLVASAVAAPANATSTSPSPPAKQPAAPVRGPFISVVDVEIKGPFLLDESFIRRSTLQNHGRVRACYKVGLAKNPKLFGHVKTRLTLETSGNVSKAEDAGSSLLDSAVVDCIVKAAPTFFPKASDVVTITYTYSLRPE